jgi:hypothetical protein
VTTIRIDKTCKKNEKSNERREKLHDDLSGLNVRGVETREVFGLSPLVQMLLWHPWARAPCKMRCNLKFA